MSGTSMQELEQYSADLKSAVVTASTKLGEALANNAALTQEQFAEVLAQERYSAIQEMQTKSQEWADRAGAAGDSRKAELFQRFSDVYADVAAQRAMVSAAEFNALTDAKMLDVFGKISGLMGDSYSAYQAYEKYSNGDVDGASATLVGVLGGMAGWAIGVALAGAVISGTPVIAAGIIGAVVGSIVSERIFPGWDSIFDYWMGGGDDVITRLQNLFASAEVQVSPIILDLDGNGVTTVSKSAGIHFDHDSNGFAELTGWVGAGDGLLVWDRNGNGVIDSGAELFGNHTLLNNGQKAANGFAALAGHDTNGNGVFDAYDVLWPELRVWRDLNQDGVSQADELLTLDELGIASIHLGYTNSTHTDAQGNAHKQAGSFTWADGSTGAATDVWFAADYARTREVDLVEVPEDIVALPDLAGFGNSRARGVHGVACCLPA